ncbi:MAG: hypothetical protein A2298_05625 [Gammaproteobacteria bacterium RIFOXYB2_FULL_38_6]|nr:MAG: hypothetical protein A2298_05625 [Gammaproteobacteria bacterium RIFOXYB2_FULL_38_6]
MDQYQQARQEWNNRIGSARSHARNWRFACLVSLFISFLLILCILFLISTHKNYVYVAQVDAKNHVVNVQSLDTAYQPTDAQKEYFIGKFIKSIMSLPLDPVVARQNWLHAYAVTDGKATMQLTQYAQTIHPFQNLGQTTKTVEILDFHPIDQNSYSFTWRQTVIDVKGAVQSTHVYNGIFTISSEGQPTEQQQILINPLGLKIVYFTFSNEG